MALALLIPKGRTEKDYLFQADTGSNFFFQYKIGQKLRASGGLELVDDYLFVSPLMKVNARQEPLVKTDFLLHIPAALFNAKRAFVQLFSYGNEQGKSPAVSDVQRVLFYELNKQPGNINMPALHLSMETMIMENTKIYNKSFTYRDSDMSKGMFWGAIISALPALISVAAPLVKNLLNKNKSNGENNTPPTETTNNNQIVDTIAALLPQLASKGGMATASSLKENNGLGADGLLGLQGLASLLEKVISPTAINEVKNDPVKLIKELIGIIGKLNPEALSNKGNKYPEMHQMMSNLGFGALPENSIPFELESKIDLNFIQVNTQSFQDKQVSLYTKNKPAYFPFQILSTEANSPKKPFEQAMVQLIVQDGETMKTLLDKKFRLKEIRLGDKILDIYLSPDEMKAFPVNTSLKLDIVFIWKGIRKNKNMGTFKSHYFTLIDGYVFDKLGKTKGNPVLLNDIAAHRAFWHKTWEGGYTKSKRWEITFDTRYFLSINIKDSKTARLETVKKILQDNAEGAAQEPFNREVKYRMKSGMEYSVELLNTVCADLGLEKLAIDKLNALKSQGFQTAYFQVAEKSLEFKGKSGNTATLWTYPEMIAQEITLKKAKELNALGQVLSFEEEKIIFPRPSHIHFIGSISES